MEHFPLSMCPYCSGPTQGAIEVENSANTFACPCLHCGAMGPQGPTKQEAETRWNRRLSRTDGLMVGAGTVLHSGLFCLGNLLTQ